MLAGSYSATTTVSMVYNNTAFITDNPQIPKSQRTYLLILRNAG
jgi:hypothetical protein